MEKFALRPQSHICVLPAEVLSLIFSNLDIEDIAHVKDTCIHFRNALQWGHREVFSYCQASEKHRKQYPATQKWQKWMVQAGLYPFTTALSDKKSEVANTEHSSAKQWLRTLGKMISTPRYVAREVYSRNYLHRNLEVHFCPTNGNLLLCDLERDWVCMLGQNETGSWFEHSGNWQGAETEGIKPYSDREFQKVIFCTDGCHLYICCFRRGIQICPFNPGSSRWDGIWGGTLYQLFNECQLDFSSSGKYLVIRTEDHSIHSIRYSNRHGYWVRMLMAKGLKIEPGIIGVRFFPLDQHLVIDYIRQLMVLSLNSDGCWDLLLTIGKDMGAIDFQLNPSGKWLLIESPGDFRGAGYLEMVRLDPLQECGPRQRISSTHPPPAFSPAGKYLFKKEGKNQYLLWRPDESGLWVRYGGLTDPGAPLSPRPGQTERDTIRFSPCDNYLLSSFTNGAVTIWGINELGKWTCRGTGQHNSKVSHIEFSQSSVHALTVDCFSIYIWGRDDCGLWSVKAIIPTDNVRHAHFHPAAEHLVVLRDEYRFQIWEMGENDSQETSVSPGE